MNAAIASALLRLLLTGECAGPEAYPVDERGEITAWIVIDQCAVPVTAEMELRQ